MDGLKVNAKGKQVGFPLVMLRKEKSFLQARWLKSFETPPVFSCCIQFFHHSEVVLYH